MIDFSMLHVQSSSAAANRISSDIWKILAWHFLITDCYLCLWQWFVKWSEDWRRQLSSTHWPLAPTFASGQLEKSHFFFFIKIICWVPSISHVQSTRLLLVLLGAQPWLNLRLQVTLGIAPYTLPLKYFMFILYVVNSSVLNSLKKFLLLPAPLLVKLSETAKKPSANIVMTVSSDSNSSSITFGHTSGLTKNLQESSYQKVRKVAVDSICRWAFLILLDHYVLSWNIA